MMTTGTILAAGVMAGATALDRVHLLQWLIARPIFSAPLIGYLLGDLPGGLLIGTWIELLWISVLPIGNFTPPDSHAVAVCAVALFAPWHGPAPGAVTVSSATGVLAVAAAIPLGILSRNCDIGIRRRLAEKMEALMQEPPPYRFGPPLFLALSSAFLKAFLLVVASAVVAVSVRPIVRAVVSIGGIRHGLEMAATWIPALGLVQLARCYCGRSRKAPFFIGAGLAAAVLIIFFLRRCVVGVPVP
ncbi:MAG: hypothetical protein D6679_14360 [Candidatus Hydrogenedentota bacterium]|nr:MAG: hypothetical protein D6679_14360 [Candidatus Hydrogenedentota bacterium]